MPFPVHVPRINTNDDAVRVSAVSGAPGAFVRAGETVLEIESDATYDHRVLSGFDAVRLRSLAAPHPSPS